MYDRQRAFPCRAAKNLRRDPFAALRKECGQRTVRKLTEYPTCTSEIIGGIYLNAPAERIAIVHPRPARALLAVVLLLCISTLATACGQGPKATSAATPDQPSTPQASGQAQGSAPKQPLHAELVARLDMPSGRVLVEMTVKNPPPGLFRLGFRDLNAIRDRMKALSVKADSKDLPVDKTSGNWDLQFQVPQKAQVLSISYSIDPQWSAPGSSHTDPKAQRSYVRDYGAVLRGCVVFPRCDPEIARIPVRFEMPKGWAIIVPWEKTDSGYLVDPATLLDDYIAMGPFDIQELQVAGNRIVLAVWSGPAKNKAEISSNDLRKLVGWLARTLGPLPPGGRSIAAFPSEYLGGGAASGSTVVTALSARTVAHEIVHWWIGWTFKTTRDATWFGEGVTDYLAPKALWESGVWSKKQFEAEIARYEAGLKTLELRNNKCYSLGEASENYWKESDPWHAVVYQKGALLGLMIDAAIHDSTRGKQGIENVVALLCNGRPQAVTTANIEEASIRATGVEIKALVDRYVRKAGTIPDLGPLLKSVR